MTKNPGQKIGAYLAANAFKFSINTIAMLALMLCLGGPIAWAAEADVDYDAETGLWAGQSVSVAGASQEIGENYARFSYTGYDKEEGDGWLASITGIESGAYSWDEPTKTLTIDNLVAESICFENADAGDYTINLVLKGKNELTGWVRSVYARKLVISGPGSLNINKAETAGIFVEDEDDDEVIGRPHDLEIKGGTINICGTIYADGIYVPYGKMRISGGTINISNVDRGIAVGTEDDLDSCSGELTITDGKLNITTRKPKSDHAIDAKRVKNKASNLGTIKGKVSEGTEFKATNGNEYQLLESGDLKLLKYGAKAKKVVFSSKAKFGGCAYGPTTAIGKKAFDTLRGKKVTYIKIPRLTGLDAYALYNTKALKTLWIKRADVREILKNDGYSLKNVKWGSGTKVAKNAFKKCGKANGAKLLLKFDQIGYGNIPYKEFKLVKRLFTSKGLSSKTKIKMPWNKVLV